MYSIIFVFVLMAETGDQPNFPMFADKQSCEFVRTKLTYHYSYKCVGVNVPAITQFQKK